jgi:hypothetical protein
MGEHRVHTRVVAASAVVLVLALAAGLVTWRLLSSRSTYEEALGSLPKATLRTTYTDWQVVREKARGTHLDAGSSASAVTGFLDRAYDLDLTSGSGVTDSTQALSRRYGFSPLDAQWEALGQSREGQVDVMRLDDDVDTDGIERALRRLGYDAPSAGSGTGGTWVGTPELVAGLSGDLTPLQQNVAVLPDQHLVLMSDSASYASEAAAVASGQDGSARSLLDDPGVASLAGRVDEPAAAVQWTSTFACEDLTMGAASEEDQQTGKQLVAKAGDVGPLEGLVMAQQPDRRLVVAMHFETSDQASSNLQARVDLASGDAPGQGGSFADRFRVTSGEATGHDVVLELAPRARQVLSDVSTGPVLFATC